MRDDEQRPRGYAKWAADRGFKMAKLFPADRESAIAELYFGDLVWAYVTLEGVDQAATGSARVTNARAVVDFWREPEKAAGWDFNLDLTGTVAQLRRAEAWLLENEAGRAPSSDEGLGAAGRAFSRMSDAEQQRWRSRGTAPSDEGG